MPLDVEFREKKSTHQMLLWTEHTKCPTKKCRKLVLQSALRILAVPYCLLTLGKIADDCRKVGKFGEPSRDIGVVAGRVDLDRGVVDALQSLRALWRQIIPLRYL